MTMRHAAAHKGNEINRAYIGDYGYENRELPVLEQIEAAAFNVVVEYEIEQDENDAVYRHFGGEEQRRTRLCRSQGPLCQCR